MTLCTGRHFVQPRGDRPMGHLVAGGLSETSAELSNDMTGLPHDAAADRNDDCHREVTVVADTLPELAATIAADWISVVKQAVAERGVAHCVHTGGRTGSAVAKALAKALPADPQLGALLDGGGAIHLWWSDERVVSGSHPDRNDAQLLALWASVPVAEQVHVHGVEVPAWADTANAQRLAGCAQDAALRYAADMQSVMRPGQFFDVSLLGIGEDGHVASLFPRHQGLSERGATAVVLDSPKLPPCRVTLTSDMLGQSRHVWFGATGEGKRQAVEDSRRSPHNECPASLIRGAEQTRWYLDPAAAS